MVVKIVLLLALGALTYQVVYVLPKKVSRTILVVGTLLTLFVLSATTPWKATNKVMLSWLALFLQSLQLVAIAGFMTQVSQYIVESQRRWHQENNFTNLHRFPISLLKHHYATVKKWITGFWFVLSMYIISGLLFWVH